MKSIALEVWDTAGKGGIVRRLGGAPRSPEPRVWAGAVGNWSKWLRRRVLGNVSGVHLPNARAPIFPAAARVRLRARQCRSRYAVAASVSRAPEHHAHGKVRRVVTDAVSGFLAVDVEAAAPAFWRRGAYECRGRHVGVEGIETPTHRGSLPAPVDDRVTGLRRFCGIFGR
jgi:hypothetical protein